MDHEESETGGSSLNAGFLDKSFVNDVWTAVDKPECTALLLFTASASRRI
jgi:hypothetical protein